MALLTSEIQRIRFELGYTTMTVGAEPYVGYSSLFETVVSRYLQAGPLTTSTTYVAALAAGADPALQTLTLLDATGFEPGATVWVDNDARKESAAVEDVVGSTIKLFLSKPHGILAETLKYQVTVEGGEAIVREIMANIASLKSQMAVTSGNAYALTSVGGLKRVDDIEFWGPALMNGNNPVGGSAFANMNSQLKFWRRELSSALGVPNLWDRKGSAGGGITIY